MQVKELESSGLRKNFKITVEAAQINAQIEKELKAAGERVKIPGFRPGFIPMKILQQRYGKSVQGDVIRQAVNRATNDAITQKKLRPALTPQINIETYKEGGDLTFTMAFDAFPTVPDVTFDKITLDRKTFEIDEKEIDKALDRIAERSPKLERAKEASKAKSGQVVTIDFKGMVDGKAFDGGTAEDFQLELGSGQFIAGFEDQLIGAQEGDDKIVKVTFPADYPAAHLAGQEASFAVKVKEIFTKETPVIDDAFAKERGIESLSALRDAVRGQLEREYHQVVRNQLKKQLFDIMEESYDFELPQAMVDLEFKTIWERLKEAQAAGEDEFAGRSEEEMKKEYQHIARRRVKLGILLAEIGNRNKIQITREELTRAVMQQASMFPGQEKKVMEFYRNNPERVDDLRGPILEEKAVDYILSQVKYSDSKVSPEDLLSEDENADSGAKKKKASKADESKPKKKKASGE